MVEAGIATRTVPSAERRPAGGTGRGANGIAACGTASTASEKHSAEPTKSSGRMK